MANSKIYHVDHVDGFFEKRISSCHREEDNVDCPGDKFHNDKLMREMTKMVLMIVWCISGAGGAGVGGKEVGFVVFLVSYPSVTLRAHTSSAFAPLTAILVNNCSQLNLSLQPFSELVVCHF